MSAPEPPKPDGEGRLYAKRRVPYAVADAKPKRSPGAVAAVSLYGVACVGCVAIAAYMYFGRGEAIASVPVIAPAAASVWFLIRMLMTMRPMAPRE